MLAPTHTHVLVVVQRAQGLRVKGKNGTNDCYITIALGKDKFMTSVQEKTLEPLWHEECELAIPKRGNVAVLVFTVHHRNKLGIDDFLGEVGIPLNTLDFNAPARNRWFRLMGRGGKDDGKPRGEIEVKIGFTYHEKPEEEDHPNFLAVPGSEGRGSFGSLADDNSSNYGKKKSPSLLNVSAKVAHQFGGSLMNLGKKVKRKTSGRHKKRKDSDAVSESAFSNNADPGVNSDSDEDEAFKDEIASTVSAASSGAGGGYDGVHHHHHGPSTATPSSTHKYDAPLHEDMTSDAFYRRLEYDDFYEQPSQQHQQADLRRSVEPSPSVSHRETLSSARKNSNSFRMSEDMPSLTERVTAGSSTPASGRGGGTKDPVDSKHRSPSDTLPRVKPSPFANLESSGGLGGGVVSARRGDALTPGDDGDRAGSLRSSAQPSPAPSVRSGKSPATVMPDVLRSGQEQPSSKGKSSGQRMKDETIFSSTPCIPAIIAGGDDGNTTPNGTPGGSRRNSATKGTRERFLRKFNVKEMLKGSGGGDSKTADDDSNQQGGGGSAATPHHGKGETLSKSDQHKKSSSSNRTSGDAPITTIENGEERIISKPASRHPLGVQQRFANMQRDDLIALVLSYENQAKQRENRMRDTEEYLDALLLRVMEVSPYILSHGFSPAELSGAANVNGLDKSCRREVKTGRFKLF